MIGELLETVSIHVGMGMKVFVPHHRRSHARLNFGNLIFVLLTKLDQAVLEPRYSSVLFFFFNVFFGFLSWLEGQILFAWCVSVSRKVDV